MLYGVTVRSTVPRGFIEDVRFDPSIPWDEIIIVRATDIPGRNVVALITDDQRTSRTTVEFLVGTPALRDD
jgi:hypothetical protein